MARYGWSVRVPSLLLVLSFAVAAGCGKDEASDPALKITFVVPNTTLSFAKEMADGFEVGVDQVGGVERAVAGPASVDGPAQVAIFERTIEETTGGVALFTLEPELFSQPLKTAADDEIPLVALDNKLAIGAPVGLLIANDNSKLGGQLAEEVIKQLPADARGTVILGSAAPQAPVLSQRAAGIREAFRKRLPDVEVLGPFDTKQDVVANLRAWKALVAANRDALAFVGTGDADGWHLAGIRRRSGATWIAGAFDIDARSLAAVEDGDLVLVSPEHFLKGAVAGRLMAQHAKDQTPLPKGWLYTPGLVVTEKNIDTVLARQQSIEARTEWFTPRVDEIVRSPDRSLEPLGAAP